MKKFFSLDTFFPFRISLALCAMLLIAYVIISFLPFSVNAAEEGLVQCGLKYGSNKDYCTICDLISLFQNLINKAVTRFAAPIAALMIAYGGFLYVWAGVIGGNPQGFSKGTKVLTNTALGIIILIAAWLLIDTVLKTLGAFPEGSGFGPWNVIKCESSKISAPTEPAPQVPPVSQPPVAGDLCKSDPNYAKCVGSDPDIDKPASQASCSNSSVNAWQSAINDGIARAGSIGGDINTEKMVKAIIAQESGGRINPPPAGAGACGLMQIVPASGKKYAVACGVSQEAASDCGFYTNPANAAASICIGTKMLKAFGDTAACGRTIRGISAGYNGGVNGQTGACDASVNCGPAAASGECKISEGQTEKTKRWECPWDNNTHTECNTGYRETRRYVPKVWYCYNNF